MNTSDTRLLNGIRHGGPTVRGKRIDNAILIVVPLIGSVYSLYYFHDHRPDRIAIVQALIWYLISGFGIGVGFHRLFTHRSFQTFPAVRAAFGIAGSFALQGSVIRWVADHRRHHRFADEDPDTHSPNRNAPPITWPTRLADFWHAHVGWMFDNTTADPAVFTPDLMRDPIATTLHRWYWPLTALSLIAPTAIGWALGGSRAAMDSFLLAGCVRTTLLHNVIWSVASVGHTFGSQPSTNENESRNNFLLALVSFGEGWHNNHHASPRCAYTSWRRFEIDLSGMLIRTLKMMGVIWAVSERPQKP